MGHRNLNWKRLVWRDEDGNEGRSEFVRSEALNGARVGDALVVYVDPADPAKSYWEKDVGEWGLRRNAPAPRPSPDSYPRRTRISFPRLFFRWNGTISGFFAILAVVVGLAVMLPLGMSASRDAGRLAAEGVWGTAEVVSRHTSGSGSKTSYWLTYRIDIPGEAGVISKGNVDRASYLDFPAGSVLDLRYWPADPQVNEFDDGETAGDARALLFSAVWSIGLGAFSIIWLLLRTRRVLALRDSVLPEEAVVLDPGGWLRRLFSDRHLRWRTMAGRKGRSIVPLKKADRAKFPPGSRILVYVDPDNPKRSYWDADIGSPPESA